MTQIINGPDWTLNLKGDGGLPHVVSYDHPFPIKILPIGDYVVRTFLDCQGKSKQKSGVWYGYHKETEVWIGFRGNGFITPGKIGYDIFPGMFTDFRTLKQMAENCCPPQLIAEIVGEEETPD